MFALRRPCNNCPFRRSAARKFGMRAERLTEIITANAFQCHKTVDYSGDEPSQGEAPQQCAGWMVFLLWNGYVPQIVQVGERLGGFDPDWLVVDPDQITNTRALFREHMHPTANSMDDYVEAEYFSDSAYRQLSRAHKTVGRFTYFANRDL